MLSKEVMLLVVSRSKVLVLFLYQHEELILSGCLNDPNHNLDDLNRLVLQRDKLLDKLVVILMLKRAEIEDEHLKENESRYEIVVSLKNKLIPRLIVAVVVDL